ncbi:MAG: TauD/TfdA family dioxygenase [Burkholderiaceae bacterium]
MSDTNLPAPYLQEISGPMVWQRADLMGSDDWQLHISDAQMGQLDAAVLSTLDLPRENLAGRFDLLPLWHDLFAHIRFELDKGRGVVLLRGIDAARYEREQLRRLYWMLATCVGQPMVQNAVGDLLGEVIDRGHDYGANNVRGYTTSAALGFHCDPADVVALLCVHPAKEGGTSHIVCASALHNEMVKSFPQYLPVLYQGFHFDLRGEGAKDDLNEVTEHRVPVFHFHEGRLSIRFNHRTIVDGMRKAGMPLQGDDLAAVDCVADLCKRPEFVVDMDFRVGDIQWLSNYDCLHARGAFTDWEDENKRRRLMRMWLNLTDGRPLRDDFSNRFNNGPKQGPKVVPGAGYWAGA